MDLVTWASILREGAIFSTVYTLLLVFILNHFQQTYNIGKYKNWPVIALFILGDCLKCYITSAKCEKSLKRDNRTSKTKKFKLKDYLKSFLIIIGMLCVYYIVAVSFGAPFFSEQEETFMFSALLTTLTIVPLLLNLGPDTTLSILISATAFEGDALSEILSVSVRFTLFGAWLGAVVIPLDWDRPWQVWPIPCSLGAVAGYVVSQLFLLSLHFSIVASVFKKKIGKYDL